MRLLTKIQYTGKLKFNIKLPGYKGNLHQFFLHTPADSNKSFIA